MSIAQLCQNKRAVKLRFYSIQRMKEHLYLKKNLSKKKTIVLEQLQLHKHSFKMKTTKKQTVTCQRHEQIYQCDGETTHLQNAQRWQPNIKLRNTDHFPLQ